MAGLLFSISHCSNDNLTNGIHEKTGWKAVKIDSSLEIAIPIDLDMGNIYRVDQFVSEKDRGLLIGYNKIVNQLEIIDINEKVVVSKIPLPNEGQNSVRKIHSFFYINKDSIILISDYYLHIINEDGQFLLSQRINNTNSKIRGIDFTKYYISANQDRPIFFDRQENAVYCALKRVDYDQFTLPEHYEGSICGRLNLDNFEFEFLPIYYPPELKTTYYGFLNWPNFLFTQSKIIYNFKYDSRVYSFDKKTRKIKTFDVLSKFAQSPATPYFGATGDQQEMIKHINLNTEFGKILYDPFHHLYYRILLIPGSIMGVTKRACISFLDSDFNVLAEMKIPKYHTYNGALATPSGIMVNHYGQDPKEDLINLRFFECVSK